MSDPTQSDPTQSGQGQTAPGWYPDPTNGQLRWWDGQQWGQYQNAGAAPGATPVAAAAGTGTVSNPQGTAALAHYLGAGLLLFTCYLGWVGPLIIMVSQGQNDPFVKDQAAEALNFQITIAIAGVVAGLLILVFVGIILLPIVLLVGVIFGIIGGMAAGRGEWYRYPFNIRMVKP